MGLIRVSTPDAIVSLADAKAHLRIEDSFTAEDSLIEDLVLTAQDYVERETRTAIGLGSFALTLDGWPASGELQIPLPPLVDVSAVTYRDPTGSMVTLPTSAYTVDATERPARVTFKGTHPEIADVPASVRLDFSAGHQDVWAVPPGLVHAIKMLVGHYYENREAIITGTIVTTTPLAVETLIAQHQFPEVV